ncbi:hypothetical protein PIB30_045473 [Stylosanthes scabra]|uniref:Secreted protein n=1 Tax=Stylosanthes scabra TaxID=79078 RepID=A0ABU6VED8_9FABA|nr:hypothetical protein [Stylosanthes scabra]
MACYWVWSTLAMIDVGFVPNQEQSPTTSSCLGRIHHHHIFKIFLQQQACSFQALDRSFTTPSSFIFVGFTRARALRSHSAVTTKGTWCPFFGCYMGSIRGKGVRVLRFLFWVIYVLGKGSHAKRLGKD